MNLSQLSPEHKTRLLAELDGLDTSHYYSYMPSYLTSYDAIIPLVQKQVLKELVIKHLWNIWYHLHQTDGKPYESFECFLISATPSQLCDAVLVAIGKAEV